MAFTWLGAGQTFWPFLVVSLVGGVALKLLAAPLSLQALHLYSRLGRNGLNRMVRRCRRLVAASRHPADGRLSLRLFLGLLWLRLTSTWRARPETPESHRTWYARHQPGPALLRAFRNRTWPADAPRFTVVCILGDGPAGWLADSLRSVLEQAYTHRDLLCAAGRPLTTEEQAGLCSIGEAEVSLIAAGSSEEAMRAAFASARGDYVVWLRHGDMLEPQALYRFAEAAVLDRPDLLYGDDLAVGEPPDVPARVRLRPAFSYDYLLSHDYLGGVVAVRAGTLRRAGGPSLGTQGRPGLDTWLRVLDRGGKVTHVPDVLARCREGEPADRGAEDRAAVQRHLTRLGVQAQVIPTGTEGCRQVLFPPRPGCRAAILIPTRDRVDLLRRCVDSLEATVPAGLADVLIVDHDSTCPDTRRYLDGLRGRHLVLPHRGPFNFSAIMNRAAGEADRRGGYTHHLLLNNDTEALAPGWLEHMLGLACRQDVGIVGALLLYPDHRVQHAGVVVGLHYAADNRGRSLPAYGPESRRLGGPGQMLLATRDQEAVTAACLLIRADVFAQLGGMDEGYAVGFGDVDLCLRARALGHKVLLAPHAVLLHHESATRGRDVPDPHPEDTRLFRARHADKILAWGLCSNPLGARDSEFGLAPDANPVAHVPGRTVPVVLPVAPPTQVRLAG